MNAIQKRLLAETLVKDFVKEKRTLHATVASGAEHWGLFQKPKNIPKIYKCRRSELLDCGYRKTCLSYLVYLKNLKNNNYREGFCVTEKTFPIKKGKYE